MTPEPTDSNFYVSGGTLRPDAPSYVERQADAELYDGVKRGEFCYVLTARQMGKSSLMVRTAVRLREEGFRVVVLDLTAVGKNLTPEQWYTGLLRRMGRQLGMENELNEFWSANNELGPLQRWMAALEQVVLPKTRQATALRPLAEIDGPSAPGSRLAIFVDEIDYVRSLPFSTDEFFAAIRECYNRRSEDPEFNRLTFCLLGVAVPSDLIRDTRSTPFNVGRRIELNDFTETEAGPLARGLGRDASPARLMLKHILRWTHGHPYLTQRLCQEMAQNSAALDAAGVDQICGLLFFSSHAKEKDANLLFVRDGLLRSESDLAGLLGLYQQMLRGKSVTDDETNPLVSTLRLSGIARVIAGCLQVRNRIYARAFDRRWIRENMPDAELRRQRAAFIKGVVRTAGLAAVVIAALAGLLWYSHRLRRQVEQEGERARLHQYIGDMNLALQAYGDSDFGRARELLERNRPEPGRKDLRGWEWRYLWRLCPRGEVATLGQHVRRVLSVGFSPDGKSVASASQDGVIKLWDVASQAKVCEFKHSKTVCGVAFSPSGKLLASASLDGTARLWDLEAQRESKRFDHPDWVRSAVFSPDGKALVTLCADGGVRQWDLETRTNITLLNTGKSLNAWLTGALSYSPDGRFLAVGHQNGRIFMFDVAERRLAGRPLQHGSEISGLGFSPDGRVLVSGGWDHAVRIWDLPSGEQKLPLTNHTAWVCTALFSPDGATLATAGADRMIRLWDVNTWEEITILKGHRGELGGIAFSPDGLTLVTGAKDNTVKLWNVMPQRKEVSRFGLPTGFVNTTIAADRRTLLSWKTNGAVVLTDTARFRQIARHRLGMTNLTGADITADRRFLGVTTLDGSLKLWDVKADCVFATLQGSNGVPLRYPTFSPDGKVLAAGSDRTAMRLWNTLSLEETGPIDWAEAKSMPLVFSADGRWVCIGGSNGTTKVWEAATAHALATVSGYGGEIHDVALSPDEKLLAMAGDDGFASLYDLAVRKEVARWRADWDTCVLTFSPDSQRLVTATSGQGKTRRIRFWDVTTRSEVFTYRGLTDRVDRIFFANDQVLVALSAVSAFRLKAAGLAGIDVPAEGVLAAVIDTPEDWQERADQFLNRGRFADAMQAMDRAIALRPTDATLTLDKGLALENAKQFEKALPVLTKTIELASADLSQWNEVLQTARAHRSELFKRLQRYAEAASDYALVKGVPLREPGTPADLVDLTLFYNVGLDQDFHGTDKTIRTNDAAPPIYNLSALPRGLARLDEVPFDVRGAVLLTSSKLEDFHVKCPEQITNVPVARVCRRLHFLQAAGWPASAGESIGSYVLHYADGKEAEIPIIYGRQVDNCVISGKGIPRASDSTVAWTGTNSHGTALRLFHTVWENPRPSVAIESMDYVSNRTASAPLLVAVTAEP